MKRFREEVLKLITKRKIIFYVTILIRAVQRLTSAMEAVPSEL